MRKNDQSHKIKEAKIKIKTQICNFLRLHFIQKLNLAYLGSLIDHFLDNKFTFLWMKLTQKIVWDFLVKDDVKNKSCHTNAY